MIMKNYKLCFWNIQLLLVKHQPGSFHRFIFTNYTTYQHYFTSKSHKKIIFWSTKTRRQKKLICHKQAYYLNSLIVKNGGPKTPSVYNKPIRVTAIVLGRLKWQTVHHVLTIGWLRLFTARWTKYYTKYTVIILSCLDIIIASGFL